MTPDEQLRLYPRETVRWLRQRLGLGLSAFALHVDANPANVRGWERGTRTPARFARRRLAKELATHLATPEGEAFAQSLGHVEAAPLEEQS
jgi:DNA-binding transcriptional regulator YiaG